MTYTHTTRGEQAIARHGARWSSLHDGEQWRSADDQLPVDLAEGRARVLRARDERRFIVDRAAAILPGVDPDLVADLVDAIREGTDPDVDARWAILWECDDALCADDVQHPGSIPADDPVRGLLAEPVRAPIPTPPATDAKLAAETMVVGMDDDEYRAMDARTLQHRADMLLWHAGAMDRVNECDQHYDNGCPCEARGQTRGLALLGGAQRHASGRIIERSWSEVVPESVSRRVTWRAAWHHDTMVDSLIRSGMAPRQARAIISAMGADAPQRRTDRAVVKWPDSTSATDTVPDPSGAIDPESGKVRRIPRVIGTRGDVTLIGTRFASTVPLATESTVVRHELPATGVVGPWRHGAWTVALVPARTTVRTHKRSLVGRRTIRTYIAADGSIRWTVPSLRKRKQSQGKRASIPARPPVAVETAADVVAILADLAPGERVRIAVGERIVTANRIDQASPVYRLRGPRNGKDAKAQRTLDAAAEWILA